jgi:S-adenosylmethionine:diacylglycerol 3-amino-3-carboxypropyl transferase
MYLQKQYYSSLRENIDRIYPHHTNLTDFFTPAAKSFYGCLPVS